VELDEFELFPRYEIPGMADTGEEVFCVAVMDIAGIFSELCD